MPDIAFHAPLKPPEHPVPSGDRKMARQLIDALRRAGHGVTVATAFRSLLRDPEDAGTHDRLLSEAEAERIRIAREWDRDGPPDLWLCYHPYYKSPDLVGPALCRDFGVPWASVEASLSTRRGVALWEDWQTRVENAIAAAAVNVALTARDAAGLTECVPGARIARLAPFIDPAPWSVRPPAPEPGHLVAVAMMRAGDKLESYRQLAAALRLAEARDWRLTIVGDGPARNEVSALFADFPSGRIRFMGEADEAGVAEVLARAAAFVWPGVGEAFGLAYLEAQAAGVPVIAQQTAGVPEVVADGETGILCDPSDPADLGRAIDRVLDDPALAARLGSAGARRIRRRHSIAAAGARLDAILRNWVWSRDG